jgi:hypothetical protein
VRPHPRIRRASPVKAIELSSKTKVKQPAVCPGVETPMTCRVPNSIRSPSLIFTSASAVDASAMTDLHPGRRVFNFPVPTAAGDVRERKRKKITTSHMISMAMSI